MDLFVIRGGNRLKGEVELSGSKNATLPIEVAAAILADSPCKIRNAPDLRDVRFMGSLLEHLGVRVEYENSTLHIDPRTLSRYEAPYEFVSQMRASIYVLGPLLARFGKAKVSFPGGCAFGPRPVDLHIKGMEALGAKVRIEHGYIIAEAERLRGREMDLLGPHGSSVGATGNVMMAAALAEGVTMIRGAAREPEIVDLAQFLNAMGARIDGAGTPVITIHGVKELRGVEYTVIPDRIEAGTFMVATAITGGEVRIKGAVPQHLEAASEKLSEIGLSIEWEEDGVRVSRDGELRAVDVRTSPFPGFPTDMQPIITSLLAVTPGISVITETVYYERFKHASELNRMGADIRIEANTAIIHGVERLSGAPVMASDLRSGAALVVAGLAAEGETIVSRVYHIDRGYEQLERKLKALGADISRRSK
ncbi:TPA: UDP-N-acetylglucosamine 1-carboxyvinyltransferase [Candidatus Poribacteria bacterium]|nr:UDP-N-acetylglucosamine 1-carboxyvinyltransferase [Candidatus Poribacteria bacterium]